MKVSAKKYTYNSLGIIYLEIINTLKQTNNKFLPTYRLPNNKLPILTIVEPSSIASS